MIPYNFGDVKFIFLRVLSFRLSVVNKSGFAEARGPRRTTF